MKIKCYVDEDWYKSSIIYLKDIFKNRSFVSIKMCYISVLKLDEVNNFRFLTILSYKNQFQKWINDKHMIPLGFKNHNFIIPHIVFGKAVKPVSHLSSKQCYKIIIFKQIKINKCCLYWENIVQKDVNWSSDFNKNSIGIKEFNLREFNFKLLYDMLPVRKNLLKWGLLYDDLCLKCKVTEDIFHAFISCIRQTKPPLRVFEGLSFTLK